MNIFKQRISIGACLICFFVLALVVLGVWLFWPKNDEPVKVKSAVIIKEQEKKNIFDLLQKDLVVYLDTLDKYRIQLERKRNSGIEKVSQEEEQRWLFVKGILGACHEREAEPVGIIKKYLTMHFVTDETLNQLAEIRDKKLSFCFSNIRLPVASEIKSGELSTLGCWQRAPNWPTDSLHLYVNAVWQALIGRFPDIKLLDQNSAVVFGEEIRAVMIHELIHSLTAPYIENYMELNGPTIKDYIESEYQLPGEIFSLMINEGLAQTVTNKFLKRFRSQVYGSMYYTLLWVPIFSIYYFGEDPLKSFDDMFRVDNFEGKNISHFLVSLFGVKPNYDDLKNNTVFNSMLETMLKIFSAEKEQIPTILREYGRVFSHGPIPYKEFIDYYGHYYNEK